MADRRSRRRTAAATAVAALALLAGCADDPPPPPVAGHAVVDPVPAGDRALVDAYVEAGNAAGDAGPDVQARFLADTQTAGTPLPPARCFGSLTLRTRLVARTLRPSPDWLPPGAVSPAARPAGAVYVVAVSVVASRDGAMVREDVGSKHLVVRDGRVTGYAACPT